MNISIQSSLCHGLRACGMTKSDTHLLLNDIIKWYDSSGPEWTNDRIKSYKAWYESYLAGSTSVPDWFRKSRKNLPTGIWGKVFRMKNPSRVFAVLSANTCFIHRKMSQAQRKKFLGALEAEPLETQIEKIVQIRKSEKFVKPVPSLQVTAPPFDCITGKSIPLSPDDGKIFIQTEDDIIDAYAQSWQNVPLATLRYLRRSRELQQVPPGLLNEGGVDDIFAILPSQRDIVGFIGLIQQPGLKLRSIANVNRITQWYLRPLGEDWYGFAKAIPSDCTFLQEKGVIWVQEQLRQGRTLSGVDLSSATDLLDRKLCVDLILRYFYRKTYQEMLDSDKDLEREYASAVTHFLDISAGEWVFPEGGTVRWRRGQPLGTHPSFALLTLTNNLVARQAELTTYGKGSEAFSHFRVIGDDIIMNHEMAGEYCRLMSLMGGEINHSKTLTSDRVAEFAGRIILPTRSFNKTVKYQDMSDNSFMSIMSSLGEQAKSLLKPRQRRVYEELKFIPGVLVDGPYSQNSYGVPLTLRYDWYLNESGIPKEKLAPDKQTLDSFQFCQRMYYKLLSEDRLNEYEYSVPYILADDFQSSLATAAIQSRSGDPRLRDFGGKTALEVLEETCNSETYQSFLTYIDYKRETLFSEIDKLDRQLGKICEDLSDDFVSSGVQALSNEEHLPTQIAKKQALLDRLTSIRDKIYSKSYEERDASPNRVSLQTRIREAEQELKFGSRNQTPGRTSKSSKSVSTVRRDSPRHDDR